MHSWLLLLLLFLWLRRPIQHLFTFKLVSSCNKHKYKCIQIHSQIHICETSEPTEQGEYWERERNEEKKNIRHFNAFGQVSLCLSLFRWCFEIERLWISYSYMVFHFFPSFFSFAQAIKGWKLTKVCPTLHFFFTWIFSTSFNRLTVISCPSIYEYFFYPKKNLQLNSRSMEFGLGHYPVRIRAFTHQRAGHCVYINPAVITVSIVKTSLEKHSIKMRINHSLFISGKLRCT